MRDIAHGLEKQLLESNIERDRLKVLCDQPAGANANGLDAVKSAAESFIKEMKHAHEDVTAKLQADILSLTQMNEDLQNHLENYCPEDPAPEAPLDAVQLWVQQLRGDSGLPAASSGPEQREENTPEHENTQNDGSPGDPSGADSPQKGDPSGAESSQKDEPPGDPGGTAKGTKTRDKRVKRVSDDSGSDLEDYDEDSKTFFSRKTKELDKIVVPSFPAMNQLINYRIALATNLATASGRYDCKEITWFHEILVAGKTFVDFEDSGLPRFLSLDVKLGVQLIPTILAKSEVRILYDDILLKQREAVEKGKVLKGRQIVWLILDYYKCNANLELVYTIEHLTGLQWMGDKQMHTFLANWHFIIGNMKDTLGIPTLQDLFERKIRVSKELSEDIGHYDRQPEGPGGDRTYKFLLESVGRAISRQKLQRNRVEKDKMIKGHGPGPDPNAMGAEGGPDKKKDKPKPKGEGQGKAKAKPEAKTKAKAKGKANAGGEGRGRSGSRERGYDGPKRVCVFFNGDGGCNKGKDCAFEHRLVYGEEKKALKLPSRSESPGGRAGSPNGKGAGRGKGAGKLGKKGDGAGKGADKAPARQWCSFFLKEAGCTNGDKCRFPHVSAEVVAAIKKAAANGTK